MLSAVISLEYLKMYSTLISQNCFVSPAYEINDKVLVNSVIRRFHNVRRHFQPHTNYESDRDQFRV